MPELTAIHLGLLVLTLLSGAALGWIFHNNRATREKIAVNAGWQEQLESQQSEHGRLAEQNKGLMEQISQFQTANNDASNRAKELTASLNESFNMRDQLQQQLKEYRSSLHATTQQRDKYQETYEDNESRLKSAISVLDQKDAKIARLKREIGKWQSRLPPLVEKFSVRNQEAIELAAELEAARERIQQLEEFEFSTHTRVEPAGAEALPDGLDASNEPHDETVAPGTSESQDQNMTAFDNPDAGTANGEDNAVSRDRDEFNSDPKIEDPADDLKQIKGIGPAIEKTLNDLGIHRFSQLAEMSEYDIDRVAQQLKGFRSRIYREDWLGQARDLQYQKSNNLP